MSKSNPDVKIKDGSGTPGATDTKAGSECVPEGGKDSLEDLLTSLSQQINKSDWLQQNTAEKFAIQNPEVAKAYRDVAFQKEQEKKDGNQS